MNVLRGAAREMLKVCYMGRRGLCKCVSLEERLM